MNIDLLNPSSYKKNTDFINSMHSTSLFPVIIKPSRITSDTATLIDNIFVNTIDIDTISGLLINDITNHLPVCSFSKLLSKAENFKQESFI